MILGFHCIFGAYGFWLPNDPRGSWSDFVRSWELYRYGPATKTTSRRSVARAEHDQDLRRRAKEALRHPPVVFSGVQARAVGCGFAGAVEEGAYCVRACSILPDHVHLVIARHERHVGRIVGHLKSRATQRLLEERRHPFQDVVSDGATPPSPWARRAWRVYLDSDADVRHAVAYVEQNPVREGLPPQRWSFVVPLEGG